MMVTKRGSMPSVHKVRTHWEHEWGKSLPLGRCWCCHRLAELQRAHVVAVSLGGSNEPNNLVLTCRHCNAWVDGLAGATSAEVVLSWVKACQESGRVLCPPHPELIARAVSTGFGFTPKLLDDTWVQYLEIADDLRAAGKR
jgi:hypothetical protein